MNDQIGVAMPSIVLAVVVSTVFATDGMLAQTAPAQTRPRVPAIVRQTDVIYGRVQGSALLADLAYPQGQDRKPAIVYVFGGRWRAGSRIDNQGNWERLARW